MNKNEKIISDRKYRGFKIQRGNNGEAIVRILDTIINQIKFILSRHKEIIVIRIDVFPANADINISKFNQDFIRRLRINYHKDVHYTYVREKGNSKYNDGIHWHYSIAIPYTSKRPGGDLSQAIRKTGN